MPRTQAPEALQSTIRPVKLVKVRDRQVCLDVGLGDRQQLARGRAVHLDVAPRKHDDQAAEVSRRTALGATPVDVGQGSGQTWTVLADPQGNEFCVLRSRD